MSVPIAANTNSLIFTLDFQDKNQEIVWDLDPEDEVYIEKCIDMSLMSDSSLALEDLFPEKKPSKENALKTINELICSAKQLEEKVTKQNNYLFGINTTGEFSERIQKKLVLVEQKLNKKGKIKENDYCIIF
ncbi:hypothetical protein SteCoe_14034 [Stentor coeruleus]|uniref:Uncharacterized protein n=1 Tax=Stentor coeruleus TaxID=5963 RepID=A0A1R2C732_9CILI|nr:hypothetical protein SteCoe_14034 [Stentor coeruleus]